jgi:2-polyprenyl-3-methyl-5-hydroxy-6-metoxy-1,4-benzoquinol methylase
MSAVMPFPADYLAQLHALEDAYLASDDPIRQSGFGGGPKRWRAEREPILDAIDRDGDLLDIGCANGYLLECLVAWAAKRGFSITPHGLDLGERLIAEAQRRLPEFAANFHAGNAWDWRPARRYRYVYTLNDCAPPDMLEAYVRRLLVHVVEPGGRLIVGSYGSRSRATPPVAVAEVLESFGLNVAGRTAGGDPPVTEFAWIDND